MEKFEELIARLHVFLTLLLDGNENSALWPFALPLGEKHRYYWGGGWVGPQMVWVLWEKEKLLLLLLERFNSKVLGFLPGDKANWT